MLPCCFYMAAATISLPRLPLCAIVPSYMAANNSSTNCTRVLQDLAKQASCFFLVSMLAMAQWPTIPILQFLCLTLHRATGHPAFLTSCHHGIMPQCMPLLPHDFVPPCSVAHPAIMPLCHHSFQAIIPQSTVASCHCELATVKQCQLPVATVKQCQSHHRPNLHQFLVAGASPGSIKWRLNK